MREKCDQPHYQVIMKPAHHQREEEGWQTRREVTWPRCKLRRGSQCQPHPVRSITISQQSIISFHVLHGGLGVNKKPRQSDVGCRIECRMSQWINGAQIYWCLRLAHLKRTPRAQEWLTVALGKQLNMIEPTIWLSQQLDMIEPTVEYDWANSWIWYEPTEQLRVLQIYPSHHCCMHIASDWSLKLLKLLNCKIFALQFFHPLQLCLPSTYFGEFLLVNTFNPYLITFLPDKEMQVVSTTKLQMANRPRSPNSKLMKTS